MGNIAISKQIYLRQRHKYQVGINDYKEYDPYYFDKHASDWLTSWIDQLLITNFAIENGYDDSPAIEQEVERMGRHILLYSLDGPLTRYIVGIPPNKPCAWEPKSGALIKLSQTRSAYLKTNTIVPSIRFNTDQIENFLPKIKSIHTNEFNTSDFDTNKTKLFEFDVNGKRYTVTNDDFLAYCKFSITQKELSNLDDFEQVSHEIAQEIQLEAILSSINPKFLEPHLQQKEHYRNGLIYNHFIDTFSANNLDAAQKKESLSDLLKHLRSKYIVDSSNELFSIVLKFHTQK